MTSRHADFLMTWTGLFLCSILVARGVDLRGRVTDSVTGFGVGGAEIQVDLSPDDGTPEYIGETDSFGLYAVTGIVSGAYALRVVHPGYFLHTNSITATATDDIIESIEMNPALGPLGGGFEIHVQVTDVMTSARLEKVPVTAERFHSAAATNSASSTTVVTDVRGYAIFQGMENGFYRFIGNDSRASPRPKWLQYPTNLAAEAKTFIDAPHLANFMLKPQPLQSLMVTVRGHDPVTNGFGGLPDVYVELEGLDPVDGTALVPPRTGRTGADGNVLFSELAAIPWRVTTKKHGYEPASTNVVPDVLGDLQPVPVLLDLDIRGTFFEVRLVSGYDDPEMLNGLPVKIEGLKDTATDGIAQVEPAFLDFSGDITAFFGNILPGRYRIRLDSTAVSSEFQSFQGEHSTVSMHLSGSDIAEAIDGMTNEVDLVITPKPAIVRVRLFAADEAGRIAAIASGESGERPIYKLTAQDGIELVPSDHAFQLSPGLTTNVVQTDASGEGIVTLLPGSYGIKIPGMIGYWGSDVRWVDETSMTETNLGWPYPELWPFTASDGFDSLGVPFESLHEYRLDLYVRKQAIQVTGLAYGDPADPTSRQILANPGKFDEITLRYNDLARGGGTVTLTPDAGPPLVTILTDSNIVSSPAGGAVAEYFFADVPAGDYDVSGSHPRSTFSVFSFTLSPWPTPGDLPLVAPDDPTWRRPLTTLELSPLTGSYLLTDQVTMNIQEYDPGTSNYVFTGSVMDVDVFEPLDYATGAFFSGIDSTYFTPEGLFFFYREFDTDGWFVGQGSGGDIVDVYFGGPLDNVDPLFAPDVTYRLTIEARSGDDPDLSIDPTTVVFDDGAMHGTPQTLTDYSGSYTPVNFTDNPTWVWITNQYEVSLLDPNTPPLIKVVGFMERGMGVSGSVMSDSVPAVPVAGASVQVRDRFGKPLRAAIADGNGLFQVASAIPAAQTVFLEAEAISYLPARNRIVPNPAGLPDINVELTMTPIPPPSISGAGMNRFGIFLAGISKAGDTGKYDRATAEAALTVTWSAEVHTVTMTQEVQRFDFPDGSTNLTDTIVITDEVAEAWVVDLRSYPTNIYNDGPMTLMPPDPMDGYAAARQWLTMVSTGGVGTVVHQRIAEFSTNSPAGTMTALGSLNLWDLPPEEFTPGIVVVTRHGAVDVLKDFSWPAEKGPLKGIRLPPWMAFATDVIGEISAAQPVDVDFSDDYAPLGAFVPIPSFSAEIKEIELGSTPTGYLSYHYDFGVRVRTGVAAPATGLAALGPGSIGVTFDGRLAFDVNGAESNACLTGGFSVDVPIFKLPDSNASPLASVGKVKGRLWMEGALSTCNNFDENKPLEFFNRETLTGAFIYEAKINLRPLTGRIPYIGPVLTQLDKKKQVQLFATLDGSSGLKTVRSWSTEFPPPRGTTIPPGPINHVIRRHAYGGSTDAFEDSISLCQKFGAGLSGEFFRGKIAINGSLNLEGEKCASALDKKKGSAVSLTFNENPDWPPLLELDGELTAKIRASATFTVIEVSKQWSWEILRFHYEFGTEPIFSLSPMGISEVEISPLTHPASTFSGTQPELIRNLYPAGVMRASSGGTEDILLYTQTHSTSGMVLRVSIRGDGGTWDAPVDIAGAGGVVAADLVPISSGGWMAAWNEVALADIGNPFPTSLVKYAVSDLSGTSWSAPGLIEDLDGIAFDLRLIPSGSFLGLLVIEAGDGPFSDLLTLKSSTWGGATWTPFTDELVDEPLRGFDVAGSGEGTVPNVAFVYSTDTGEILGRTWDGATVSQATTLTNDALDSVAIDADTNGVFMSASASSEGSVSLFRFHQTNGWSSAGTPFTDVLPVELHLSALQQSNETSFLTAWVEPGPPSPIFYGFVDDSGTVQRAATDLTRNLEGRYHDLTLLPGDGWEAQIVALFTTNPTDVREFSVSLDLGNSANDLDGDSFNDLLEYVIIDAVTNDSIVALADVSPFDDFDNDGLHNWAEIVLGLDPTDPEETLHIDTLSLSNETTVSFLSAPNVVFSLDGSADVNDISGWNQIDSTDGTGLPVQVTDTNAFDDDFIYRLSTDIPPPMP